MNNSDLENIFDRIKRLSKKIDRIDLCTQGWDCTLSDGRQATYIINNIKDLKQIEDELTTLFIWTWSFKDYVKEYLIANNINPKKIESYIDEHCCPVNS